MREARQLGELERIAAQKRVLQARIALHRLACRLAGEQIAQPVRLAEGMMEMWRQFSPGEQARTNGDPPPAGARIGAWVAMLPPLIAWWQQFRTSQAEAVGRGPAQSDRGPGAG